MTLNSAQKEAISHLDGPMMVLAGPGSGKTSVIAGRTASMILEGGVSPDHILVVTFSRMAAKEMKERFAKTAGMAGNGVTFGTFHGVFYGILKAAYGFQADNILTGEEKTAILRQIVTETADPQMLEGDFLEDLIREISLVKAGNIAIEHYHSASCPDEIFTQVYQSYEKILKARRKLDFDDMIVSCYDLLIRREDILNAWRQKFRYILVDEFQDISPMQYKVVRLLAAPLDNLFIVGDDDQSIYHFRGANPEIMLGFCSDYPEARRVLLNVNYRCSGNILQTAAEVIGKNRKRFQKELTTPNPEGDPVGIRIYANPREQFSHVASLLKKKLEEGKGLEDTALLFRTNQEAEGIVGALMNLGIPFMMKESLPNLFQHWICRDLLCYLSLAGEVPRRSDFLAVMNRPNRYLSRQAVMAASVKEAGETRIDFNRLEAYYQDKVWMKSRIRNLRKDLAELHNMAPYGAITYIRKAAGYEDYLREYAGYRRMKPDDLMDVLDRLHESARGYASVDSWTAYMEDYARELKEQARKQKQKTEGVTLATLHSVKGLEYDTVYILNVNEGSIPYRKAVLPDAIEEERRLFYVGMTRARKNLNLCFVRRRYETECEPSRFLLEAGYRSMSNR